MSAACAFRSTDELWQSARGSLDTLDLRGCQKRRLLCSSLQLVQSHGARLSWLSTDPGYMYSAGLYVIVKQHCCFLVAPRQSEGEHAREAGEAVDELPCVKVQLCLMHRDALIHALPPDEL